MNKIQTNKKQASVYLKKTDDNKYLVSEEVTAV